MKESSLKEKLFDGVIRFRVPIMIAFVLVALLGAYARQFIKVNYDMNDYLPEDSPSTVALDVMNKEFDSAIPNARVAINNVNYGEAMAYKEKLEQIPGVESVTWLDDSNKMNMPLNMLDKDTVETYYKDNTALYTVTIEEKHINDAVPAIRKLIGKNNQMTGSAVSTAIATKSTVTEIQKITGFAILMVLFMLIMTTASWVEPFVVLIGVGVAVMINAGSNLIFGEISFVTNAAGNILQLAVSLDYSVFLIHRFEEYRNQGMAPEVAMKNALCKSTTSIAS
ncbi:MAG: MMPL family transporter, partial [Eubacteriales bacterium]|nr:MMPL family transporter [Eubacteriales bacterium]